MKRNKAYKYRLYPNAVQRELFAKTFGCTRFVYNKLLEDKIEYYKQTGEMLINTPASLKQQFGWLREVDSMALCNAQIQLQTAYKNFFRDKSIGFPQFKSKHKSKPSYTTNFINGNIEISDGFLKLPKAGRVNIRLHRDIPEDHKIKSVTVSQDPSGKYYASILTEYECEETESVEVTEDTALGLDYSSPHFYVDSNGNTADMSHFYREAEKKLARAQRKLSKMTKGSNNYKKQRIKVALAYEKVRNSRKDWQHKKSRELADNYSMIAVEDINYKAMAQGLKLAKSTNDNSFGQFRTMLSYKLAERGKRLITIDKWFPSTKTCGVCGAVNSELTLKDREWTCPHCGTRHNRDINAARNIRDKGLTMVS